MSTPATFTIAEGQTLRTRGAAEDSTFRRLMSLGDRLFKPCQSRCQPREAHDERESFRILRARGAAEDSAFRRLMSPGDRSFRPRQSRCQHPAVHEQRRLFVSSMLVARRRWHLSAPRVSAKSYLATSVAVSTGRRSAMKKRRLTSSGVVLRRGRQRSATPFQRVGQQEARLPWNYVHSRLCQVSSWSVALVIPGFTTKC